MTFKSSENVKFALRIVQKYSVKNKTSWDFPEYFANDIFKVRELGFNAKKCRFLVETFSSFESKVSFFGFNFIKLLNFTKPNQFI